MSKHPKTERPSDKDLRDNPLIGGGRGATRAHATPEDIEEIEGENTVEGDVGNDTTPSGGVDERVAKGEKPLSRP